MIIIHSDIDYTYDDVINDDEDDDDNYDDNK